MRQQSDAWKPTNLDRYGRGIGQIRRLPCPPPPGSSRDFQSVYRSKHEDRHSARRRDDRPRPAEGRVIELGMVKFDYLPDGRIASIKNVFSSFNEPCEPIPR